jgi:hypothetical protein
MTVSAYEVRRTRVYRSAKVADGRGDSTLPAIVIDKKNGTINLSIRHLGAAAPGYLQRGVFAAKSRREIQRVI